MVLRGEMAADSLSRKTATMAEYLERNEAKQAAKKQISRIQKQERIVCYRPLVVFQNSF